MRLPFLSATPSKRLLLPRRSISRRNLFRLGAAGLTLPFLTRHRQARASTGGPKRLIVFHYPQGTVMDQFVPSGTESNFQLPLILEPLEAFKENMLVITGVDNLMPLLNSVGTQHWNANLTFMTAQPFHLQDENQLAAGGPSIDQVVSERIGWETPYPRLDFSVGGVQSSSGIWAPTAPTFWHAANDPVATFNHPQKAIHHIFGNPNEEVSPFAENRELLLSKLLLQFDALSTHLNAEDRLILDAHADKVEQLHHRISSLSSCAAPELQLTTGYNAAIDDQLTAPLMNEVLVHALACDYTKVATLGYANGRGFGFEDHAFSWLWEENGGPIVDHELYDTWHAMVHADYVPGMQLVFRWYMEMFADLLKRLSEQVDIDGENLLETSLVLCLSEFSSGRHWNNHLPVIVAGNMGDVDMGRWINKMPQSAEQFQEAGDHVYSGSHMGQLYTSILQAFGFDDEHFGYEGPITLPEQSDLQLESVPKGALAGL